MDPAPEPAAIEFGRFSVLPHRRELLAEGRPVELGGRAFDVLMVLIEESGTVVSKDTLMKRVWPDRIIEENSLQHQILRHRGIVFLEYKLPNKKKDRMIVLRCISEAVFDELRARLLGRRRAAGEGMP